MLVSGALNLYRLLLGAAIGAVLMASALFGDKHLASLLDLLEMDPVERHEALRKLGREAKNFSSLSEIAKNPEAALLSYGEIATGMARLLRDKDLAWVKTQLAHEHPVGRYLAMSALRLRRDAQTLSILKSALGSKHADLRALSLMTLRRFRGEEVEALLSKNVHEAKTAAERSCARAALEWKRATRTSLLGSYKTPLVVDAGLALDVKQKKRKVKPVWKPETLRKADLLVIPHHATSLGDVDRRGLIAKRILEGATLVIQGAWRGLPRGTSELLKVLGLSLPQSVELKEAVYVNNCREPHPLHDFVQQSDLARIYPIDDAAQVSKIKGLLVRELPRRNSGFTGWDAEIWCAPLVDLDGGKYARLLDAPAKSSRGRVVLDLGSGFRLWEYRDNWTADLSGLAAVYPKKYIKEFKRNIRHPYTGMKLRGAPEIQAVPWGKPLSGGPVEVGFMVFDRLLPTVIGVEQCLDIEAQVLHLEQKRFGSKENKKRRGPPVIDAASVLHLKHYLDRAKGVLVMTGYESGHGGDEHYLSWNGFSNEVRTEIAARVREGLGLVVIGPHFLNSQSEAHGFEVITTPEGLDKVLPVSQRAICYRLGKGRIVHLPVLSFYGRAELYLPESFKSQGLLTRYDEIDINSYFNGLVAAAITWADGREWKRSANKTRHYRDRYNRVSESRARGPQIEETRYLDAEGRVLSWSARIIEEEPAGTARVNLHRRLISPDEKLEGRIVDESGGDRVIIEVRDHLARLRASLEKPISKILKFSLPAWTPIGRYHRIEARVYRGDEVSAEVVAPFAVDTRPDEKELQAWVWGGTTFLYQGFKAAGVSGLIPESSYDRSLHKRLAPKDPWVSRDMALKAGFEIEWGGGINGIGVPRGNAKHVRKPCISNPSFWSRFRGELKRDGEKYALCGTRKCYIQDETKPGHVFCHAPGCLAEIREYLKAKYGNLEALNRAWRRDFKHWGEVKQDIFLKKGLDHGNRVSWADGRLFWEKRVAYWTGRTENLLREWVPGAKVGLSAYFRNDIHGGFNSALLSQASGQITAHRKGGSRVNHHELRDMGRPENLSGHWYEAIYRWWRGPDVEKESLLELGHCLQEQNRRINIWYGYVNYEYPFIQPNLRIEPSLRAAFEELKFLQGGLDRLLLESRMNDGRVAVLFSPESARAAHALKVQYGRSDIPHTYLSQADFFRSHHVQARLISASDILLDELERRGTRLLIMTGIHALDKRCVAKIRSFVERGGRVIADLLPGSYSTNLREQGQDAVAKLFGVRGSFDPANTSEPAKVEGRNAFSAFLAKSDEHRVCIRDIQSEDARAHGRCGATPVFLERKLGKGKTLLLNLPMSSIFALPGVTAQTIPDRFTSENVKLAGDVLAWSGIAPEFTLKSRGNRTEDSPIDVSSYRHPSGLLIAVLNRHDKGRDYDLNFKSGGVLYSVREGKKVRGSRSFAVKVPGRRLGVFLFRDKELGLVEASHEMAANGEIVVSIESTGPARVVHVRARDPQGDYPPHLRRKHSVQGKTMLRIPTTSSEGEGNWTIEVRDVITGQVIELVQNLGKNLARK